MIVGPGRSKKVRRINREFRADEAPFGADSFVLVISVVAVKILGTIFRSFRLTFRYPTAMLADYIP